MRPQLGAWKAGSAFAQWQIERTRVRQGFVEAVKPLKCGGAIVQRIYYQCMDAQFAAQLQATGNRILQQ